MTKALNLRAETHCVDKAIPSSTLDPSILKILENIQSSSSRPTQQDKRLSQYARKKIEKRELQNQFFQLSIRLTREVSLQQKRLTSQASWKELARHQRDLLQSSQARQKWLRQAIAGKKALINDLIALVHQQLQTASSISIQSHDNIFLQPTDDLLYAMDIHELQDVYAKTDDIFRGCRMDSTDETIAFKQIVSDERSPVLLGWKQYFPFGFKRCCDTMWMLANLVHRQEDRRIFEGVKDSKNIIAAKFRIITGLPPKSEAEALDYRFVHRRFMEKNRMVFVWKALIVGDGIYKGLRMKETGWCLMRPSMNGHGTVGQVCVRQDVQPTALSMVGAFSDFTQSMVRENHDEVNAMASALLLEDALNGIVVHQRPCSSGSLPPLI